ncbi:hypothetical protein VB735_08210 [Halotia wernerae UHCC 0503]|nr:hypothetical protein [Halotia wernerae UHCC 0503]
MRDSFVDIAELYMQSDRYPKHEQQVAAIAMDTPEEPLVTHTREVLQPITLKEDNAYKTQELQVHGRYA